MCESVRIWKKISKNLTYYQYNNKGTQYKILFPYFYLKKENFNISVATDFLKMGAMGFDAK